MNTRISRISAAFAVLALVGTIAPVFAAEKITPTSTFGADAAWNYGTYTVNRFVPTEGARFQQLEGLDALREQGILAVANEKFQLFILREGTLRMEQTPFTLPATDERFGCATSLCTVPYPKGYLVGSRIVVTTNNKWYLYDAVSDTAELWFDPTALGMSGGFMAVTANNQLYVYSIAQQTTTPTTYWVSKPNHVEQLSELPSDVKHVGYRLEVDQAEAPVSTAAGMIATDDFGATGVQVGQVGEGVYVNNRGALTRIGFSTTLYGPTWTMSFTPKTVLAYGATNAAWVGLNGELYVAVITFNRLEATGLQDVPGNTPFRTVSNPAVFYSAVSPVPVKVYMTAAAYIRDFNDPPFSKVVVIADGAFDAAMWATTAEKVY